MNTILAFLIAATVSAPTTCWKTDAGEVICMTQEQMTNAGMLKQRLPDGTPCFLLPNGAEVCTK